MVGGWIVLGLIVLYVVVKFYRGKVVNRGVTNATALRKAMRKEDEPMTLIDVRTPAEYRDGHIPGAINIPHTKIAKKPPLRPKDTLLVVYCRSGNRAMAARTHLRRHGFERVANFGGVGKWDGQLVDGSRPGELVFD